MAGPFRFGSGSVSAHWNFAGSMSLGVKAPVLIEGCSAPLVPMVGMVAVPAATIGVGGT
jgi:hypothetical protein